MGLADKLPKTEKMAFVISTMLATMCHKCDGCVKQRHLFWIMSVPNEETERCRDCIDVQYKLRFKDNEDGNDG